MSEMRIAAIQRWPVKGLGPDRLQRVELERGRPLPFDRAWAIENGPSGFDADAPAFLPKIKFLMLMRNEKLAALETAFEEETLTLEVRRHGKPVARGRLDDPLGRMVLEQFFAAYMGGEMRGAPKILSGGGHSFSDVAAPVVSLIGLGSVADLARVARRDVDPLRFRANVHIEGLGPWEEFDLVGREITVGQGARLRVKGRITRCAATNVDPATGARDMQIPRLLQGAFSHDHFGVYAEVIEPGEIAVGDPASVCSAP